MAFHLTYEIEDAGWAKASFQDGEFQYQTRVSYFGDALSDLARAAIAIRDGASTARAVFLPEPGALHLVLEDNEDALHYELRWFGYADDFGNYCPDDIPEIIHRGETSAWEFVAEIRKQLHRILRQHGLEGYKKNWIEDDFPIALYNNLFNKPG